MRGRTKEAEELWKQVRHLNHGFFLCYTFYYKQFMNNVKGCNLSFVLAMLQATNNYEKAVQLNWNSPQVTRRILIHYLFIYFINK